ncbi:isoprenyl transferase [Sphingomonas jatrophae]|uniref:Isoprenyl transferase n=1 Tax=Sphingomonas jatrophae TaxID=1166337 RepID=A0A1I6JPH1_9SPHN|nr:isoprenyl transferase [Sphingomonas jatrophae]SFR80879.1 undecaprenyl diphosphate synthase [Sphingomonas jatrophae]
MSAARASAAAGAIASAARGGLPRHVAIIMDGNGRWAKKRLLPRVAGHRAGVDAVRKVVRAAGEIGVEALTLYAFSSENWRRPQSEIADLMGLLRRYLLAELEELAQGGVQLRILGDLGRFDPELREMIEGAVARTASNEGMILAVALNYGAQDELVEAARALATDAAAGRIEPAAIDASAMEARLSTAGLPPLDLMIRTSGEKRLSNFLLWQAAYAELIFVDTLWPDFDRTALEAALADYARRERRYGGL